MKRIAILFLLMPVSAEAASINNVQALGCQESSTQQSMRLYARSGEGKEAEEVMRNALKTGSCRWMPSRARVAIKERIGPFVCVKAPDTKGRCEWVEATDIDP